MGVISHSSEKVGTMAYPLMSWPERMNHSVMSGLETLTAWCKVDGRAKFLIWLGPGETDRILLDRPAVWMLSESLSMLSETKKNIIWSWLRTLACDH